jgi:2-C-methyl-D-erythritol 4-phosphate cytidylyltransferase
MLIVAAAPSHVGVVAALVAAYGVTATVVAGGAARQASVGYGLAAVPETTELVLVHDAVRPFVTADRIADVVAAARAEGAAALAVPVADTLRGFVEGVFAERVEREGVWGLQTPQPARLDWLREAYAAAARDGFVGTDEVALLQHAGRPVRLVEGDVRNFKLTHRADWALARALWAYREQERGEGAKQRIP